MSKKITVSAPGKLMLLGEYAVVYNRACLVTAIDKRLYATVEIIDKQEFQLEAEDVRIAEYKKPMSELGKGDIPKGARFAEMTVKNTLELNSKFLLRHSGKSVSRRTHPEFPRTIGDSGQARLAFALAKRARMTVGIRITTKSEFSCQFGFGSSSAATVCVIKALSGLLDLNLSQKEIFDLSYKTILDIQGKGSGFDVGAAVYGGTLYFVTGGKAIESFNIKAIPLVVGYSGIKADTVQLINKVKEDFSNRKNRLEEIYNAIEVLVNKAKAALIKKNWETLGDLMNQNQNYLKELGVSTPKLDNMIKAALDGGAYGAKLSGAGGGDCMIATATENKKLAVEEAIIQAGGKVISVETNAEGVRIE